jgi:hypothetical protein
VIPLLNGDRPPERHALWTCGSGRRGTAAVLDVAAAVLGAVVGTARRGVVAGVRVSIGPRTTPVTSSIRATGRRSRRLDRSEASCPGCGSPAASCCGAAFSSKRSACSG